MAEPAGRRKKKKRGAAAESAEGQSASSGPSSVSDLLGGLFAEARAGPSSVSDLLGGLFAKQAVPSSSSSSSIAGAAPAAELDGTFSRLFAHGVAESQKRTAVAVAAQQATEAVSEAERAVRGLSGKRNKPVTAPDAKGADTGSALSLAGGVSGAPPDLDSKKKSLRNNPVLTREEKEEQDSRTVFIGNIPLEWNERNLKAALHAAVGDKYTGRFHPLWFRCQPVKEKWANPEVKKVGCIKMDYAMNAADDKVAFAVVNSVEAMNTVRRAVHGVKADSTHILRADGIGAAAKKVNFDRKRSIFVGNLPRNTGEADLRKVFEQVGQVDAVRIVREPATQQCKGIAFVLFADRSSQKPALEYWGTAVRGREIRVSKVEAQEGDEEKDSDPDWLKARKNKAKAWATWRVDKKLNKMRKNHSAKAKKSQAAAKRDGNTKVVEKKKKDKSKIGKLKVPKKAGAARTAQAQKDMGNLKRRK